VPSLACAMSASASRSNVRSISAGVSLDLPIPASPDMSTGTDQIADHHQTGCDTDTRLQGRLGIKVTDCSDQLEPRSHGPLCVVFMRLGVTEINEHPIAHILRYEPAEALHDLCDAFLVGRDNLAEVFRVHPRR